jgi:TolA-binding protein
MPPAILFTRLALIIFLSFPLILSSCSYLPWVEDNEDDLAFEEDFPFEDEEFVDEGRRREKKGSRDSSSDDDFFGEDKSFSDSGGMESDDGFADDDDPDGFASGNMQTERVEIKGDVENLQTQQETLISKVRELEEVLNTLEPKIDAATEQIEEGASSSGTDSVNFLEPEVEDLKTQIAQLNEEVSLLKIKKLHSPKINPSKMGSARMKIPPEYEQALTAYRNKDADGSILLFQNLALSNPPDHLKDNIEFWIGCNYVALEMYDDAILQFETVLNKYPRGNKVHDSRYMIGVSYSKMGETSRAIEVLEDALKRNPPNEVRTKITAQLKNIQ